jgi:hypothetical protein
VQYSAVQCGLVQFSTDPVQFSAVQRSVAQRSTLQCSRVDVDAAGRKRRIIRVVL